MLDNLYETIQFQNPAMAYLIHADLMTVALCGMSGNRARAYPAVKRLRSRAEGFPIGQAMILDKALRELGYDFEKLA